MYLYITKSLIMAYNANGINVVDLTKYTIPARVDPQGTTNHVPIFLSKSNTL